MISDDMNTFAEKRILEREQESGVMYRRDNCVIAIKTWSQVIEDNKARLQFFQEKLQHQVDDETALIHLQEKYEKFLSDVVTEEEIEKRSGSGPEKIAVKEVASDVAAGGDQQGERKPGFPAEVVAAEE